MSVTFSVNGAVGAHKHVNQSPLLSVKIAKTDILKRHDESQKVKSWKSEFPKSEKRKITSHDNSYISCLKLLQGSADVLRIQTVQESMQNLQVSVRLTHRDPHVSWVTLSTPQLKEKKKEIFLPQQWHLAHTAHDVIDCSLYVQKRKTKFVFFYIFLRGQLPWRLKIQFQRQQLSFCGSMLC